MQRPRSPRGGCDPTRAIVLAAALVFPAAPLLAQGVTTAGVEGIVTGPDASGIDGANVTVTNTTTGERWHQVTGSDGRYVLEYVSIGGPYSIEAAAIGFTPASVRVPLSLGQRYRIDFRLTPAVATLPELSVTAPHPRLNPGRTGPSQTIGPTEIAGLPLERNSIAALLALSPQAVPSRDSGISIAAQPDRLNSLQVDGSNIGDLGGIHGISGIGTPGAASRVRVLPIEAIKEIQIQVAPFDVRYGNFAGALVNAVTRSGTNRWEGSLSSYVQSQSLTGKDSAGNGAADYSTRELTLTLGGPIVHDRAAFFLTAGLQRFIGERPPALGTDTTGGADSAGFGIRRADAVRFRDILSTVYSVPEPGTIGSGPPRNPAGNVLAKVTLWPGVNQRLELSHNHAEGQAYSGFTATELSSHGSREPSAFDDTRLVWTMAGGSRLANELTLGRLRATQRCFVDGGFPQIEVMIGLPPDTRLLIAGDRNGCPERHAEQATWELTDNVSWYLGAHHLTVGTHAEAIHLTGSRRVRVPSARWTFPSLDALEAGEPSRFVHDFARASRPRGPVSDFIVHQVGFYAQDQWTPVPRLSLTAGLRVDVPYLPRAPEQNPELLPVGVNTAVTPSGNALWSPRLGFNYDLGGRGSTFLRGGIGLFSGRPMYLYFSNIFETTGLDWLRLDCIGTDAPAFTIDPARQPTSCPSREQTVFEVNYFSPSFRFPRNLRLSLGGDARLPWGLVGTVDLLLIRGLDQFDITDINLQPPVTTSAGEGGRLLYGSFDQDLARFLPNRVIPGYETVAELRNSSGDRSISASAQLHKHVGGVGDLSVSYTYTDAHDRMSVDCFTITCNLFFTPLDGTLEERSLRPSSFEVTHKLSLAAVASLPLKLRLGLFYAGYSGRPYTYLIRGDANGDGLTQIGLHNDIVYVPREASDIALAVPEQWTSLDSLIRSQDCLRRQRGHIMRRNSCRGNWATVVNGRLSRPFGLGHGQSIELSADVFNLLNLFDRDWGVQRTVASFQGDPEVLEIVGYDQGSGRGIYSVLPVDRRVRDDGATRWRLQLGARYAF